MTVRFFSLMLGLVGLLSIYALSSGNERVGAMNSTSVMSYNIHLDGCNHDHLSWKERRSMVAQVIRLKSPEIVGLQGTSLTQLKWLLEKLGPYEAIYNEDSDCMTSDKFPILFDHRIYEAKEKGTETLNVFTEKGQDQPLINWVKLEHLQSERILYVINTSMESQVANRADLDLGDEITQVVADIVGTHTFMMLGDVGNTESDGEIEGLKELVKDSQESSFVSISDIEETYLGWEKGNKGVRADYVLLSHDIPANSHEVLNVAFQNQFPSDHLPIYCKVRLN